MKTVPLLIALATSRLAAAQPTASAEADALFDQARTLLDGGKYAEACTTFDASQKLSPAIPTLFNQANCRELNGQYATAYGLFREAERQTRVAVDEPMRKLNRVAVERTKALEPRLSKLTIVVGDPSRVQGLTITRSGVTIDAGAWNRQLPVDGGTYEIVARAPDREPWATTVEIGKEADAKTIEVPLLPQTPKAIAAAARSRSKIVPLVFAGSAVALFAGALGAKISSSSDLDASNKEVDNARQDALWNRANTKLYVAQGLAVGGLACAGVAVWMFVRGRGEDSTAPTTATRFEPVVGPGIAGLQLSGGF